MGARLRVVLDQVVHAIDPDQAAAAVDLTAGLLATAPSGCSVDAIVPAGTTIAFDGVADVHRLALGRRELAIAWRLGIAPGVGGGLIHSPSLMAPLVRHDRLHDSDQTTVTVWDVRAWDAPHSLPRNAVMWQRAMLQRAVKHADAVVVPSHAIGERLAEIAKLANRIRVIAGAAPHGFTVPADAAARRAALALPERYIVLTGSASSLDEGMRGVVVSGLDGVVLDVPHVSSAQLSASALAVGLPEHRTHIQSALSMQDRAAILSGASAFVATSDVAAWPWRLVEAMTLGVPVVAVDSGVHHDVIADGGLLVPAGDVSDAIAEAVDTSARRLSVLAADRSRAFSWASSAERVWGLHADL